MTTNEAIKLVRLSGNVYGEVRVAHDLQWMQLRKSSVIEYLERVPRGMPCPVVVEREPNPDVPGDFDIWLFPND